MHTRTHEHLDTLITPRSPLGHKTNSDYRAGTQKPNCTEPLHSLTNRSRRQGSHTGTNKRRSRLTRDVCACLPDSRAVRPEHLHTNTSVRLRHSGNGSSCGRITARASQHPSIGHSNSTQNICACVHTQWRTSTTSGMRVATPAVIINMRPTAHWCDWKVWNSAGAREVLRCSEILFIPCKLYIWIVIGNVIL